MEGLETLVLHAGSNIHLTCIKLYHPTPQPAEIFYTLLLTFPKPLNNFSLLNIFLPYANLKPLIFD